MTCQQLIGYINTRKKIRYFYHVCCYDFFQGRKDLYNTAVYVIKKLFHISRFCAKHSLQNLGHQNSKNLTTHCNSKSSKSIASQRILKGTTSTISDKYGALLRALQPRYKVTHIKTVIITSFEIIISSFSGDVNLLLFTNLHFTGHAWKASLSDHESETYRNWTKRLTDHVRIHS